MRLLITKDPKTTLNILGLDKEQYYKGFKTMFDLFGFILTSPYLHISNKMIKNQRYSRPIFRDFFIYMRTYINKYEKHVSKNIDKQALLLKYDKIDTYNKLIKDSEDRKKIKRIFNGRFVRKITGLQDKELGDFMEYMRYLPNFKDIFLKCSTNDCGEYIKDEYIKYKSS